MLADYVYFYLDCKEIENLITFSTVSLACALIIESYAYFFNNKTQYKTLAKIQSGRNGISNIINSLIRGLITIRNITTYLPLVIRFVPIGIIWYVVNILIKKMLKNKIKSIN